MIARFWLGGSIVLALVGGDANLSSCRGFGSGSEVQVGLASWYGSPFDGRTTASGETFDKDALTAAHRTLPFGTLVRVTNRQNGRSVEVVINDRGPYSDRRIIDLSEAAARLIGMLEGGVAQVEIVVLRQTRQRVPARPPLLSPPP